jgi:putative ABC transport system permease protein
MLKNYLKVALKVLARRKFFTFISLFGISFTLVVLMVVAAMLDHQLAASAPETRLDRTLFVSYVVMQGENMRSSGSPGYLLLDTVARDLPGVEQVTFYTLPATVVSYRNGEKLLSNLRYTDTTYWEVLDFTFLEGRPLTAEDEALAEPVAVISEGLRRRYFGDDVTAVGQFIEADNRRFRVKGVVEKVSSTRMSAYGDIWLPLTAARTDTWRRELRGGFNAMIVADDPGSFPAIKAEFRARMARLPMTDPESFNRASGLPVTRFEEMTREVLSSFDEDPPVTRAILILSGLALGFMLLPTINLININISRIFERASEIGVRKAFGASSAQLIGQFVVGNVILSLIGGAIGLAGAAGALAWLNASGVIPGAEFTLNPRVFVYALGLSIFFGVLSGVYPAWRMSRLNPVAALKGGRA